MCSPTTSDVMSIFGTAGLIEAIQGNSRFSSLTSHVTLASYRFNTLSALSHSLVLSQKQLQGVKIKKSALLT